MSDVNTNTIYFFDRTSVTNQMQEKYLVESGLTFINEENTTKPLTGGLMVQTDAGETITYELNNINVAANESIEISLVNDFMIQVNNGNENSQYDLSISYWSNSEVHEFEYSGISFSANATHIISPFAPAGDSFDPAIFVDEGQNGSNEDTLFFDNQLMPNLFVEVNEIRVTNEGGERQALVQNSGSGQISWSASTSDSWITLTQGNGINTGLITFTTNANPNTQENRTGYIYVEGNGQSDTLTVVQGEFDLVGTIKVDDKISLQIYPNPATEMITISNKGEINYKNIEIFDLTGRKMDVKIFKSPTGMAQVIVDHLSSGVYFVKITTKDKEYSVKFIKN